MRRILVATTNRGKMAEFSAMLGSDVEWVGLGDVAEMAEVVEDGSTFAENAVKKAVGYAQASGLWTVADDSGLVIDALDGAPGIMSARFSGERLPDEERTLIDHRNIAKVLQLMKDVPAEKRTARFVCSLCLASPEGVLAQVDGTMEGMIAAEKKGKGGFGYDPIMYIPQLAKTVAELSADEKNKISHRGSAIEKLKPLLDKLVSEENS
ncbi:MAG: XTP/dITP diphosphatase [Anaerohalosphaera sp.]|nr:XTP/dITP diphosphatase [Anaerohalosphaera sp.]